MPVRVVVVGAGVSGVTAAAALHQAGHTVTVVEKSQFAGEVGAALNLTPNGVRVLQHLGFDLVRAGAVSMKEMVLLDGTTLQEAVPSQPLRGDYYAIHRGDLHRELMRITEAAVVLRLGAGVSHVDVHNGIATLADGSKVEGDLVVGADGVHSVVRSFVLANIRASVSTNTETAAATGPQRSGCSAFRFLLPTSLVQDRGNELAPMPRPGAMHLYLDPSDPTRRRHVVWYACRSGTLQNFVAVNPDPPGSVESSLGDEKALLLREFGHFHPQLRAILEMATSVRLWPFLTLAPLPHWSVGCTILIGDAAHPMLPFSGQGANQAIEDAGALGFLLSSLSDTAYLPQRLALFERVRIKRASRVQVMSRAVAGWEESVQNEVAAYSEEGVSLPTNIAARLAHDALFDVHKKCLEILEVQA